MLRLDLSHYFVDVAYNADPYLMKVFRSTHSLEVLLRIRVQRHVNDGVQIHVQVIETGLAWTAEGLHDVWVSLDKPAIEVGDSHS